MFCTKCGKEISNQAKFCNYCGSPINNTPPAPQRAPQAASQPASEPVPAKKKGNAGRTILTVVLAAAVFFGAKTITAKFVSEQNKDATPDADKIVVNSQDSDFEKGFKEALAEDPEIKSAMESCFFGALYQDGSLRYGMTKLDVPGYTLLAGEGDERDWLISSDNACLIAAYKQLEILDISYDASTEEGLLNSYTQSYSDASMIEFNKYYVNDFPVISYIVGYTANDVYQYQGEIIVFPSETADETIRLAMFVDVASGYGANDIEQVFDTLEVSTDLKLKAEDTGVIGLNRITVK